ncbi:MAG: LysM peptidoglycan-binding domain-containing protein [Anaerolineales bacterium]|nr:LysM peptidoglycan-binding domain-containing protein [Anaerolineales bacterium]
MKDLRQAVLGILAALISTILLLGSIAIALIEGQMEPQALVLPTATPSATLISTATPTTQHSPTPGPSPIWSPTPLPPSPTQLPSQPPTDTPIVTLVCDYPPGWEVIQVQPGDTLEDLATKFGTTIRKLVSANCLLTDDIFPGMNLYVPAPPPTAQPTRCGPPVGWVYYTVRAGDTLYGLALMFGTTVRDLQQANCLGTSTLIRVGQRLAVPNVPTRTPMRTPTPRPSATEPALPTSTEQPTSTPTPPTMPPPGSLTPTPTPTETGTPTTPPAQTDTPTPATTSTEEKVAPSVTPSSET